MLENTKMSLALTLNELIVSQNAAKFVDTAEMLWKLGKEYYLHFICISVFANKVNEQQMLRSCYFEQK